MPLYDSVDVVNGGLYKVENNAFSVALFTIGLVLFSLHLVYLLHDRISLRLARILSLKLESLHRPFSASSCQ